MTALQKPKFVHGLNVERGTMLDNIRANCARDIAQFSPRRAVFVAGGPSASDHIGSVKVQSSNGVELWCANGAHDWLLRQGISPDVCVLMDADVRVLEFVGTPVRTCRYLIASQAHPALVDRMIGEGYRVELWHAAMDPEAHEIMGNRLITSPCNTVGLHTLQLMCLSGIRHVRVYGLDSSHRPDADHAYDNSHQKTVDEHEFVFDGKTYMATGTWGAQAALFQKMLPQFERLGMRLEVIGDGLIPAIWRKMSGVEA